MSSRHQQPRRRAFTVTEMLVVISVFIILLGLLLPGVAAFRKSGQLTKSMAHMRQISGWLALYADDNRDFIIPSQFNYSDTDWNPYPGKVRSTITEVAYINKLNAGTWADIIWSEYKLGVFPEALPDLPVGFGQDFRHDSPDGLFYGQNMIGDQPSFDFALDNPLRSAALNTRNTHSVHDIATPFGIGAGEKGLPGYFAANNFFNADRPATSVFLEDPDLPEARFYSHAQIRMPARSMYLVDSFAGEVIQPVPDRYRIPVDGVIGEANNQVDFRYSDLCLMLFLDGHSETQAPWYGGIQELEGFEKLDAQSQIVGEYVPLNRGVRVRQLDRRISSLVSSP